MKKKTKKKTRPQDLRELFIEFGYQPNDLEKVAMKIRDVFPEPNFDVHQSEVDGEITWEIQNNGPRNLTVVEQQDSEGKVARLVVVAREYHGYTEAEGDVWEQVQPPVINVTSRDDLERLAAWVAPDGGQR